MRPQREAYVRTIRSKDGVECSVGLELRDTDSDKGLSLYLLRLVDRVLALGHAEHMEIVGHIAAEFQREWPDRAFFIETEQNDRGVQVFQPFGVPRNS